ncbi:MAG: ECF transporter S component [Eubacterium sp.]|nr:ECF transporter S component [Eubacterium sp.]
MKTNRSRLISNLTIIAVFSAISYVLAFFEIPAPLAPSFARMDFSNIPALLVSFAIGPIGGMFVELIKNLLQLTSSSTAGIGELANFLMGAAFVMPAGMIYKRHKTKKNAILGCVAGSVISGAAAVLLNYFVLLPLYSGFMPIDAILAMYAEILPFINTKFRACLWAFPGNVFQCALYSIVTMLIYKPLSPILHRNLEPAKQTKLQEENS